MKLWNILPRLLGREEGVGAHIGVLAALRVFLSSVGLLSGLRQGLLVEAHGVGCFCLNIFFPFLYYVVVIIIIINDENYSFSSKLTMVSRSPSISLFECETTSSGLKEKKN